MHHRNAATMVWVCALSLCSSMRADERTVAQKLDPSLPYQARKTKPVTYEVDFSVVITAPSDTKTLKVWLPLPPSEGQEVKDRKLTTFPNQISPKIATEKVFGNTFAYFEFDRPRGAQIIRQQFSITTWEMHWDIDPKAIVKPDIWPAAFNPYLQSDDAVKFDEKTTGFARQIVKDRKSTLYDLEAVM